MSRCRRIAALLLLLVPAPLVAAPPPSLHLFERYKDGGAAVIIDGVWMRTLAPFRPNNVVSIDGAPAPGVLRFSVGLHPAQRGAVHFEIVFVTAKGDYATIYSRDLQEPGWYDEEVDLGDRDLKGASLFLRRRSLTQPKPENVRNAFWGEPIIVPRAAARRAPSVILISIDTLRADAVGIYGSPNRTPAIDGLARAGVRYTSSYSASTWTYPSHAALLRGLTAGSLPERQPRMAIEPATAKASVAQIFRTHDYATAGFTGGGFLSLSWGFPEGFDRYFAFERPEGEGDCRPDRFDGPEVFARAQRWLEANRERPFFLFVHTYDVHDRCPVAPKLAAPFDPWPDPGPAGRQKVVDYYDSLVGKVDVEIGAFLARVEALGLAQDTIVVLTGDHGEAFWEHGQYGHGCAVRPYDPVSRVPLIVHGPGVPAAGAAVDQPVSAADVAPTLLALSGVPIPADMEGRPLPGLGLAGARDATAPVFVQCGDNLTVRIGANKLLTGRSGDPGEVFDLARDAAEAHNIAGADAAVDAALSQAAKRYWSGATAETRLVLHKEEKVDDATRERLRALGYLK